MLSVAIDLCSLHELWTTAHTRNRYWSPCDNNDFYHLGQQSLSHCPCLKPRPPFTLPMSHPPPTPRAPPRLVCQSYRIAVAEDNSVACIGLLEVEGAESVAPACCNVVQDVRGHLRRKQLKAGSRRQRGHVQRVSPVHLQPRTPVGLHQLVRWRRRHERHLGCKFTEQRARR